MAKVLYVLLTFLESGLAMFGIRATFEEPQYRVVGHLSRGVEIRDYGPRVAVETAMDGTNDGQAFSRLFRYITGANKPDTTIAMTTPVEMRGGPAVSATMRFFIPRKIADAPPLPTDTRVRIVHLPSRSVAVLRFSGRLNGDSIERHEAILREALAQAGRKTDGAAYVMGYDPPFTLPFLRRNEVALDIED